MVDFKHLTEAAKVHPMAVHAYSVGGGMYKVHATGSDVKHVKAGETISSSDLDDLSDAGHKVKEVKKPSTMKEDAEPVEEMSAAYKKMLKYQKKKK